MSHPTASEIGALFRTAAVGTVWLAIAQQSGALIALACNLFLARWLGPDPFGIFFLVITFADLLFLLASPSFGQYLIQAPVISRRHYHAAILYSSLVAATVVLVAGGFCLALQSRYPAPVPLVFLAFCLVRAVWMVSLVLASLLERAMQYGRLGVVRVAATAFGSVSGLVAASMGAGLWALFAREAAMVAGGSIFVWCLIKRQQVLPPAVPADSPYRDVWRFGWRLSGVQFLEQVFHRADGVFLGQLLGLGSSSELGLYAQAKYLANLPHAAADPGTRAVCSRIYAILRAQPEALEQCRAWVQFWAVRLVMPFVVIVAAFPEQTVLTVLGSRWASGGRVLWPLAPYSLVMVLFNNMKMLRLASEDWRGLYRAYCVQLVALIFALPIGVYQLGIVGASCAFALATVVGLVAISAPGDRPLLGGCSIIWSGEVFGAPAAAACIAVLSTLAMKVGGQPVVASAVLAVGLYSVTWIAIDAPRLRRSLGQVQAAVTR